MRKILEGEGEAMVMTMTMRKGRSKPEEDWIRSSKFG